jgi:hypothetical protein
MAIEEAEKWLELLIKWGVPEREAKIVLLQNILGLTEGGAKDLFSATQKEPSGNPR